MPPKRGGGGPPKRPPPAKPGAVAVAKPPSKPMSRATLALRTDSVVMSAPAAEAEAEPSPEAPKDAAQAEPSPEAPTADAAAAPPPPASPATPAPAVTRDQLTAPTDSVRKMLLQTDLDEPAAPLDRGELIQRSDSVSKMFADPSRGQTEGTIRVEFAEDGPIGLELSGSAEAEPPSIREIYPDGAASTRSELRVGLVLIEVQGETVGGEGGLGFHAALEKMRTAPRPLTLVFAKAAAPPAPSAVSAAGLGAGLMKWTSNFLDQDKRPQPLSLGAMDPQELAAHQRALEFKITEWIDEASSRQVALAAKPPQLIAFAQRRNLYHLQPEEIHNDFVQEGALTGGEVLRELTPEMLAAARSLRARQATSVRAEADEHWALLSQLWAAAGNTGEPPREAVVESVDDDDDDDPVAAMLRVSSRPSATPEKRHKRRSAAEAGGTWTKLGFQNELPATDFRAGGLLSLQCMAYFSQKYEAEFRQLVGVAPPPGSIPAAQEPEPEPELEPEPGSIDAEPEPGSGVLVRTVTKPSLECPAEGRRRLGLALTVIHMVDMLGKLLGLEEYGPVEPGSANKAADRDWDQTRRPSMLLANALRACASEGDVADARDCGYEEVVCAAVLRFGRLWVGVRAEHAQFEQLVEVMKHDVRQLLLTDACERIETMQQWAAEAPPDAIPVIGPPPSLPQDEVRKVRGIRLRIPPGSGPVGLKFKPVQVPTSGEGEGEVVLQVVEIVEETVAAACVGQGLEEGCELHSIQARLVSEWESGERFTQALALLHELLATDEPTELVFTPPRPEPVAAAAEGAKTTGDLARDATATGFQWMSGLSRQMSVGTKELVDATNKAVAQGLEEAALLREVLQQPLPTSPSKVAAAGSKPLGMPPTSAAPKPAAAVEGPEMMVEFREDGPLGINFESSDGIEMRVTGCVEGGAAAAEPDIVVDSVVLAVNGASVVGLAFHDALGMIKSAQRPLVLAIRHPAPQAAVA